MGRGMCDGEPKGSGIPIEFRADGLATDCGGSFNKRDGRGCRQRGSISATLREKAVDDNFNAIHGRRREPKCSPRLGVMMLANEGPRGGRVTRS